MITPTWITDPQEWNTRLQTLPKAHILQSWEWGEFKHRTTGWTPERIFYHNQAGELVAGASLLTRRIGPLQVLYVPKGPIFCDLELTTIAPVLEHLQGLARKRLAVWLKIDPDVVAATGLPENFTPEHPDVPNAQGQAIQNYLQNKKWRFSPNQVQFRNTSLLDLTRTEDELLAGMNQSTRRKIRLAEKGGVTVRTTNDEADLRTLYEIYAITGQRQGFTTRPYTYYLDLWKIMLASGFAQVFVAEAERKALAGVIVFRFSQTAWYFYGMSSNESRDLQPTYALQWTAIRWARTQGCTVYDWWGAPNEFTEDDPMWGVYRFKEGFGGRITRHIGAWDTIPYPLLYWAYEQAVPRIIGFLRRRSAPNRSQPME
ncbi:MAG: peptidoglycan bridge formation glycyltransferase FemA/FemB family protein [Anaerolineae bacterium]|nr:MAG: peptidoglycan bridge formation glycyltransferase FemA/FemB family protein [Anaerolineae bacterium]